MQSVFDNYFDIKEFMVFFETPKSSDVSVNEKKKSLSFSA